MDPKKGPLDPSLDPCSACGTEAREPSVRRPQEPARKVTVVPRGAGWGLTAWGDHIGRGRDGWSRALDDGMRSQLPAAMGLKAAAKDVRPELRSAK